MLDIPAREVTSKKRPVVDVNVKKWVGFLPVKLKPAQMKMYDGAAHAVSYKYGSSIYFSEMMIFQYPKMTLLKTMDLGIFGI